MRYIRIALASTIIVSVLAGCQSTMPPPAGQPDTIQHEMYPRIVVEQPLQRFFGVSYDAIIVDHGTADRPMHVSVPVRSLADTQMRIQWRYRWMDDRGRIIQDTSWRMAVLEPRLQTQLTANATQAAAVDWRLEVRSAR
jgi:uncharacterized protein YcfL